jgi:hypothetical protein
LLDEARRLAGGRTSKRGQVASEAGVDDELLLDIGLGELEEQDAGGELVDVGEAESQDFLGELMGDCLGVVRWSLRNFPGLLLAERGPEEQ